jgi:hypothetical protein
MEIQMKRRRGPSRRHLAPPPSGKSAYVVPLVLLAVVCGFVVWLFLSF